MLQIAMWCYSMSALYVNTAPMPCHAVQCVYGMGAVYKIHHHRSLSFIIQIECSCVLNGSLTGLISSDVILQHAYIYIYTCLPVCLHVCRVVYRDLKPENILMDSKGRTKISDLGECPSCVPCCSRSAFVLALIFKCIFSHTIQLFLMNLLLCVAYFTS